MPSKITLALSEQVLSMLERSVSLQDGITFADDHGRAKAQWDIADMLSKEQREVLIMKDKLTCRVIGCQDTAIVPSLSTDEAKANANIATDMNVANKAKAETPAKAKVDEEAKVDAKANKNIQSSLGPVSMEQSIQDHVMDVTKKKKDELKEKIRLVKLKAKQRAAEKLRFEAPSNPRERRARAVSSALENAKRRQQGAEIERQKKAYAATKIQAAFRGHRMRRKLEVNHMEKVPIHNYGDSDNESMKAEAQARAKAKADAEAIAKAKAEAKVKVETEAEARAEAETKANVNAADAPALLIKTFAPIPMPPPKRSTHDDPAYVKQLVDKLLGEEWMPAEQLGTSASVTMCPDGDAIERTDGMVVADSSPDDSLDITSRMTIGPVSQLADCLAKSAVMLQEICWALSKDVTKIHQPAVKSDIKLLPTPFLLLPFPLLLHSHKHTLSASTAAAAAAPSSSTSIPSAHHTPARLNTKHALCP